MATSTNFKIGDILKYDVGYSMVLPHFAVIAGFTPSGKSAYVYELATDFEPSDPPYNQQGYKTPNGRRVGERMTCRIKGGYVRINNHAAWLWNGQPALYDSMD